MPNLSNFSHIILTKKVVNIYKSKNPPGISDKTKNNLKAENRASHGRNLRHQVQEYSRIWAQQDTKINKIKAGIPFILEIDPSSDVDFLRNLGFEIVSELDNGFILVSTNDTDATTFLQKISSYEITGYTNVAYVYGLSFGDDRIAKILSPELAEQWENIENEKEYIVEISVACTGTNPVPAIPSQKLNESKEEYELRIKQKQNKYSEELENIINERQQQIENIVADYGGTIPAPFIEDGESFSTTIQIVGKGLRDLAYNYPYIFDISFKPAINSGLCSIQNSQDSNNRINVIPPQEDSPIVVVIDSGIQEKHRYIEGAILSNESVSLLENSEETSDEAGIDGHGTRVAGSVLYPYNIPESGDYQLPCFIRNLRVLDSYCSLPAYLSGDFCIQKAVELFSETPPKKSKIYNHSIGDGKPFTNLSHMSAWAAMIDNVSYENDVLFIQAAGNIPEDIICCLIKAGNQYPTYLGHELTRIADPAQSLHALTVGAVSSASFDDEDNKSLGNIGEPSAFTRVGPGIWDSIKPDVVEAGGTLAQNKNGNEVHLTQLEELCLPLIRRSPTGFAFAKDDIGTSFATPKVSYIALELQKLFPTASPLLYRALIAQSARWNIPAWNMNKEDLQNQLRYVGYGKPDIQRALGNSPYRVTLMTNDAVEIRSKEAHIYTIQIPESLRNIGDDYDILIEVTLSYVAKPRRTRKGYRGYLSTWVDWCSSKMNESADVFATRVFENANSTDKQFKWFIHEQANWGQIKDYSRQKQTLQKDFCVIKSNQLPKSFCIAVRGHKGWGDIYKAKYALVVSFEAINNDIEVYEPIRISNIGIEIDNTEVLNEVEN